MPDLLLYINSLLWRFVHFSSGPDARVRDGGMARVSRGDRRAAGKNALMESVRRIPYAPAANQRGRNDD
jgi:hypothetical protein